MLKILGLINNIDKCWINKKMTEINRSQEFTLKNIEEINNFFIKQIDQKKLLGNKHIILWPISGSLISTKLVIFT